MRGPELAGQRTIEAELVVAGYPEGDCAYNALTIGSDGRVYFALSTHHPGRHARLYRHDPASGGVSLRADLASHEGEGGEPQLSQGKIHVPLQEHEGHLYFSSSPSRRPGKRKDGTPDYPGGRFHALDLASGELRILGTDPGSEGIISMAADPARGRIYGLTWPSGRLLALDLPTGDLRVLGAAPRAGRRDIVCRALLLDPRDGAVYWTTSSGDLWAHRFDSDRIEPCLTGAFADPDLGSPTLWRQAVWHSDHRCFYGITHRGGRLFRFDPEAPAVEVLDRTLAPAGESGWRRWLPGRPPHASLALQLAPDGGTLHYLSPGPRPRTAGGRRVRRSVRWLTFDLGTRTWQDHGALRIGDGRHVVDCQALALGSEASYAVVWIEVPENLSSDSARRLRQARARFAADESGRFVEQVDLVVLPSAPEEAAGT